MKRIIGMGNALVDALTQIHNDDVLTEFSLPKGSMQLVDAERYRAVSDVMKGGPVEKTTGGSAANTILAIARLGGRPGFIGRVGTDDNGRFFSDSFRNNGVQTYLNMGEEPTGVASTFISPDGQRTFATYLGAAAGLAAEDLNADWFAGYDYFYVEGYLVQSHDLIDRTYDMAHAAGLSVCLDMASYNIVEGDYDFFDYLVDKTDFIFANADEARVFTGKGPHEAVRELASRCHVAVVKNGGKGALACSGGTVVEVPAMEVERVVDTTAAGDYFSAGFLQALAQGGSLLRCVQAGTLLAGHIIQVVGTALSDAAWQDIRATGLFR